MDREADLKAYFFEAFASRLRPAVEQMLRADPNGEGAGLRTRLASRTSRDLSVADIRDVVTGNSWMLTPQAFRYFLPAFLWVSVRSYDLIPVFVSELVNALTEPCRADIVESLDLLERAPPRIGLSRELTTSLRKGQLEWFDSGAPTARFHECFDELTAEEGAVIATFFAMLKSTHAADFTFQELDRAVDRTWSRYGVAVEGLFAIGFASDALD
jgi:hypothetical protein